MRYFTTLYSGEPHEPKTAICVHHSYDPETKVVNIFDYEVFREDKQRIAKPVKYSEEAVRVQLKAHLFVHGVKNSEVY